MMNRTTRIATATLLLIAAPSAIAGPTVTMTQTTLVRVQAQGGGTYNVLDFFYSASPGAEFTNYRLIVNTPGGNHIWDPARLQDWRQHNSANESSTTGSVDTFINTVMSNAAAEDVGYAPSIMVNSGSYNPTGSGSAPAFALLDWSVFDTQIGDDNNLNDYPPPGPFAVAAPYRLARILLTPGAQATIQFQAFDTLSFGVPTIFQFTVPCPGNLNGDNTVNVADLLALIGAWGPNPGHAADLDGNGTVNVSDLLILINEWGPC